MTTITDVAAHAGVSMKTVSRVLNGEAHVRDALRDRVLRSVAALEYRPNLAARQLAGSRSFVISLVLFNRALSYLSQVMFAAAAECRRHGYHLVSETFGERETGEVVIARLSEHLRPDGVILTPPLSNDPATLAAVERSGIPLVRIAGVGPGYGDVVPVDERPAAKDLVDHLIACGHRRIALIAPPELHLAAQARMVGYEEALIGAGIEIDRQLVVAGEFTFASGAAATARLLDLSDPPTAIFASNDGMALGAMAEVARRGLRVPQDVAIAGFDDSPASRMVFPALTTVRQPIDDITRAAVAILLGKPRPTIDLEHRLVIRGSTSGSTELVTDEIDA